MSNFQAALAEAAEVEQDVQAQADRRAEGCDHGSVEHHETGPVDRRGTTDVYATCADCGALLGKTNQHGSVL